LNSKGDDYRTSQANWDQFLNFIGCRVVFYLCKQVIASKQRENIMITLTRKLSFAFQSLTIMTLLAFMWAFLLPHESIAQQKVETLTGTTVALITNTTLTPEQFKVGDAVELSVVSDVVVNGEVVIKAGAGAKGEITVSKERSYIGIAAKIGLAVKSVQAVDGTTIPLSGSKLSEGKDKMVMSIGLSIVCCILFALKKGGEAFIQAGTPVDATVSATTPVTVQ